VKTAPSTLHPFSRQARSADTSSSRTTTDLRRRRSGGASVSGGKPSIGPGWFMPGGRSIGFVALTGRLDARVAEALNVSSPLAGAGDAPAALRHPQTHAPPSNTPRPCTAPPRRSIWCRSLPCAVTWLPRSAGHAAGGAATATAAAALAEMASAWCRRSNCEGRPRSGGTNGGSVVWMSMPWMESSDSVEAGRRSGWRLDRAGEGITWLKWSSWWTSSLSSRMVECKGPGSIGCDFGGRREPTSEWFLLDSDRAGTAALISSLVGPSAFCGDMGLLSGLEGRESSVPVSAKVLSNMESAYGELGSDDDVVKVWADWMDHRCRAGMLADICGTAAADSGVGGRGRETDDRGVCATEATLPFLLERRRECDCSFLSLVLVVAW
jgi:hypothetical protein